MGSDGKDDVVLSKDTKTDIRIINEDEKLFLKRVEESKGDLNHIFNTICGKYELMDDFSLLSINYMGVSEELDSDLQVEVETVIADAKDLITKGKYSEVANLLQPYYDQRKGRHQVAQYLIKSYMKLKIYDKASKIAKEFLDENEVDTDIMFKASYCLKMNHEFEEAIEMAERVKLREPKNIRNLVHLADMYAFTKNYPRAKKIVNKILVVEPNNKPAIKIKEALEDKVPI
jgi:tetratricopeptide (TPR) repeat protein